MQDSVLFIAINIVLENWPFVNVNGRPEFDEESKLMFYLFLVYLSFG